MRSQKLLTSPLLRAVAYLSIAAVFFGQGILDTDSVSRLIVASCLPIEVDPAPEKDDDSDGQDEAGLIARDTVALRRHEPRDASQSRTPLVHRRHHLECVCHAPAHSAIFPFPFFSRLNGIGAMLRC